MRIEERIGPNLKPPVHVIARRATKPPDAAIWSKETRLPRRSASLNDMFGRF
jgi:hypothetical protein